MHRHRLAEHRFSHLDRQNRGVQRDHLAWAVHDHMLTTGSDRRGGACVTLTTTTGTKPLRPHPSNRVVTRDGHLGTVFLPDFLALARHVRVQGLLEIVGCELRGHINARVLPRGEPQRAKPGIRRLA